MQKPMYPCKVIRITQKDHEGTHSACWAVDEAGVDGEISNFIMPFDGVVKKLYPSDANEVWIESLDKVEYPDGTIDYMTILLAHDNDISNLYVGQIIKAGTIFYQEGTKGQATGNHVHFECGKGKFTGSGWYKDAYGAWSIINGKKATECLWIDDSYTIMNTRGYTFKKVVTHFGTPVQRDESVDQVQIKDGMVTVRARKTANGEILGYMNIGLYNILEYVNTDGYTWYRVEDNLWFAYSPDWAVTYPKQEQPIDPTPEPTPVEPEIEEPTIEELQKRIDELEYQVSQLNAVQDVIEKENESLKKKLEDQPILIFTSPKTDLYAIELLEGRKLYTDRV